MLNLHVEAVGRHLDLKGPFHFLYSSGKLALQSEGNRYKFPFCGWRIFNTHNNFKKMSVQLSPIYLGSQSSYRERCKGNKRRHLGFFCCSGFQGPRMTLHTDNVGGNSGGVVGKNSKEHSSRKVRKGTQVEIFLEVEEF